MRSDNKELIEQARKASRAVYLATDESVADDLSRILIGLTDALERVTAERDKCKEGREVERTMLANVPAMVESIEAERDKAEATLAAVRAALANHPECDKYTGDDVISCGWRSAVADVTAALAATGQEGENHE